jgi:hypothetical protein
MVNRYKQEKLMTEEAVKYILDHGQYRKSHAGVETCHGCGKAIEPGEHYYHYSWGWKYWHFCHICNNDADVTIGKTV